MVVFMMSQFGTSSIKSFEQELLAMNRFEVAAWLVAASLLLSTGCSSSQKRVSQPEYSSSPGAAALAAYDSNSDDVISNDELDQVPALKASISAVDTDKNGRISAQEIDDRVNAWKESRIGKMAAICEVTLDGKPLANAEVVLEPEPFVGSNLPSGSGTTGEDGWVGISLFSDQDGNARHVGMPPGWYKIRVTSPDHKIPARYNSNTTLGCEIANYSHWENDGAVKLDLTSQ